VVRDGDEELESANRRTNANANGRRGSNIGELYATNYLTPPILLSPRNPELAATDAANPPRLEALQALIAMGRGLE
jgi:hypothetical protein